MMRAWKPMVLGATMAATMAATIAAGSGSAFAHNKGDCSYARGRLDINGHACVVDRPKRYTVSVHDVNQDFRNAYIEWKVKGGGYGVIHDGSANGPNYDTRPGDVVRFRVCESYPKGGKSNDPCWHWERNPKG